MRLYFQVRGHRTQWHKVSKRNYGRGRGRLLWSGRRVTEENSALGTRSRSPGKNTKGTRELKTRDLETSSMQPLGGSLSSQTLKAAALYKVSSLWCCSHHAHVACCWELAALINADNSLLGSRRQLRKQLQMWGNALSGSWWSRERLGLLCWGILGGAIRREVALELMNMKSLWGWCKCDRK